MSAHGTVLYDAPGPRTVARHRVYTVVASAVLGAFRDDQFDSTGLVKSLWLERITRTASDTEVMIEELMRLDAGGDESPSLGTQAFRQR